MKIESTNLVTEKRGPRPAGSPNLCFYCGKEVGEAHKEGCVMVEKFVVVKLEITYIKIVPAHWEASDTDFYMNDSSSCASNLVREVNQLYGMDDSPCPCPFVEGTFVRDATADDLENMPAPSLED